jgi:hypothetical protein
MVTVEFCGAVFDVKAMGEIGGFLEQTRERVSGG